MDARLKAKELIRKFYSIGAIQCKECALIAVDEILNSRPAITDSQIEYQKYWQEVKNEIEKL
jgi:hypothetical protein